MTLDFLESQAIAALAHPVTSPPTVLFSVPAEKLQTYQGLDIEVVGSNDDMLLVSVEAEKLRDAIASYKLKFLSKLAKK